MSPPTRVLVRSALTLAIVLATIGPTLPASAAPPPVAAPRLLTIVTVPPIPGVSVVLDGVPLTTGADGMARTLLTKEQRDAIAADRDAHLAMSTRKIALSASVRARFHGWYDGGYRYSATDRSGQVEVAAFDVDYLTDFSFVDARGAPVAPKRVTRTEFRDTLGTTVETRDPGPVWIAGRSVVSTLGRVTLRDVEYRFTEVMVDKVNVVRRGTVRFMPRAVQKVPVPLSIFTVTFHAQDAFFGRPRGSKITLTLQDGTTRHRALKNGSVTVRGLTPGKYVVETEAMGLGKKQTFAISHGGRADIEIIDPLDLGVLLVVAGTIVGLLVAAGLRMRKHRAELLARRDSAPSSDVRPAQSSSELSESRAP